MKGENSVKVYGNDLETLEKTADAIAARARQGAGHHRPRRAALSGPADHPHRRRSGARGALWPGARAMSMRWCRRRSAARAPAILYEGTSDRHFPMMVRLAAPYRQNLDAIRRIPVAAAAEHGQAASMQVPLEDVADVHLVSGAAFIYREQQQRYVPIKFSVRGRDLGRRRSRGAARRGRAGALAGRLPPRMGGRIRQSAGGDFALERRGAAVDRADHSAAVFEFPQLARCAAGRERDSHGACWAASSPFGSPAPHSACPPPSVSSRCSESPPWTAFWCVSYYHLSLESGLDRASAMLQTCRTQLRPVVDDLHRGLCRADTRGVLHRHRVAGAAAAGDGRGRAACCSRPC